MAQMPLRDGDPSQVGGFRLVARLRAGGMGVVYLATAKDGAEVAVKVLRSELGDDADFRVRFRREVALLARVQGLCTVRVIGADTESATPFLATEYAPGPSLAEYIAQYGPLRPGMLYGLATGLAEALTAIHAAGVIHRDLKPGNILLTPTGPKVIDFGIAQALDATSVTRTGVIVGSPGFMAPEQVAGQAGQLADIFAWGVTIAYAAAGQSPFGTGPADAIAYRILREEPAIPPLPEPMASLVASALAKDPAARPPASSILTRLAAAAAVPGNPGLHPTQSVLARMWQPPPMPAPVTIPANKPRWRRGPVLVTAAALVAALAAGARRSPWGRPVQPGHHLREHPWQRRPRRRPPRQRRPRPGLRPPRRPRRPRRTMSAAATQQRPDTSGITTTRRNRIRCGTPTRRSTRSPGRAPGPPTPTPGCSSSSTATTSAVTRPTAARESR